MRYVILALILMIYNGFIGMPERLEWNAQKSLQWSDFKGDAGSLENWAASSSTGMSQSYGVDSRGFLDKNDVVVKAYFYPQFSWVKDGKKSPRLLSHEQTHFDITEVYVRKLAKLIKETEFTQNSLQEIKALYSEIEKERVATQDRFDLETRHSLNQVKELEWQSKVRDWLLVAIN